MSRVVFLDTETTGLNPHVHDVWEVAVITRKVIEHEGQPAQLCDTEHVFHIKPDLSKADPTGLRINRYYERTAALDRAPALHPTGHVDTGIQQSRINTDAWPVDYPRWQDPTPVAMSLARLLDGAHLVGAVPSFDAAFLSKFLHRHGQAATWHYHLIDVEALAVGYLNGRRHALQPGLPWDSDAISLQLGLPEPEPGTRHTALDDARWARDIYDTVTGRAS